jgi:uncharacterized protein (DUF1800 family)
MSADRLLPDGENRTQPLDSHPPISPDPPVEGWRDELPAVVGEGLEVIIEGRRVWLSSLPANLREVLRGLENGMFGPPVPVGTRGDGAQRWANAAMHIGTIQDAIRAVETLNRALAPPVVKKDAQEEGQS